MPHAIADYDTDLIQLNVWTGTKWVNIFDGNDMNNLSIDLHRVAKVVDDQVVQINDAVKRADDAVKQAGKAIDDSATNKQAIDDVNKAVDEAKQSASDALDRIKSLATDSTIEDIQKQIKDTSDSITKIRDDQTAHLKDVTDQINDAVAKAKAAADSLNAKTEALQSAVKNAQSDATVATQTASEANITAIDAKGDAAVAMATAKQVTVDMKNVQNDILAAKATASEATITAGNAASDAITAKTTASAASVTATDAKSDVAEVKATAQSISSRVSAVESDANKKIAANSTAIEQNKNAISLKADQSLIDKLDGEMSSATAQLEVQAGQISSKAESTELKKVSDKADSAVTSSTKAESDAQAASTKADSAIASAAKNTTAIDQNSKAIALKADQTTVDKINKTATDNSAAVNVLNNEIKLKVDSTTVNKMIDDKGFTTAKQAQALVDQSATKLSSTITELKTTVDNNGSLINSTNDRLTNVTQAIDGLQTTVKDKANQSQITQLANALQVKLSGSIIAQATDVTLTYTGKENEYPPIAPLVGMKDVDKGSRLILTFDYVASADTKLTPQLDGDPWVPWGTIVNATPAAKGKKGSYSKTITVNDDSWQKGNAKNLCIRCDGFKGTIEITNLVLKYADTTLHDVQSSFDMLRDDINLRVTKGKLISQINLEAGRTLIQSSKIFLDADSVVFGGTAFIPSAAIVDIAADKITSGTLDAGNIRVINLTADNIHGGTLDVGNMHVKNFSANDIEAGLLSGVTFRSGTKSRFFQTSKDNIYWFKDLSAPLDAGGSSMIGADTYINPAGGLTVADTKLIQLTTWGGGNLNPDGTVTGVSGTMGHPKLMVDLDGVFNPLDEFGNDYVNGGAKTSSIYQWVSDHEFTRLSRHFGFQVYLNSKIDHSEFYVQKDNKVGAYFGGGNNGNEITFSTGGDGTINFNSPLNVYGPLNVTGAKHSIVKTSQGYVGVNAYETAEYYFGDIGEANTGDGSQVIIGIDKIFSETINTKVSYQVFITPYSDCHVWVDQRFGNRFVVKSDKPNAQFGWELKAKRKGYENYRLRHVDGIKEKGEFKV